MHNIIILKVLKSEVEKIKKNKRKLRDELYGILITLAVIFISILISKSYLNQYFDVILYAGVFLVASGFIYGIMKFDNIKIGQTIIIGGIATMLLSCLM